jgi:probable selenium-dependent hydroxylase accessory protein YqeC
MYALAAAHRGRVLLSSTAHMYPYESARVDRIISAAHPDTPLADCADARVFAVCGESTTPHRVGGLSAEHIRRIFDEQRFDLCVIKADGARARWIKSPGAHEPLIPSFAQTVIPVVAASVIGRPLDARIAHRPERLTALLGIAPGARITPEHIADLLSNPMGALKNVGDAVVIPLINMVDDEELHALARRAARAAMERSPRISRIVLASMRSARIVEVVES